MGVSLFNIKILFLSLLVDIIGREEISLSIEERSTIRDVLKQLVKTFGKDFENTIFKPPDEISKYIILSLNGKDIRSIDNLNTLLHKGDEIILLPAIAGG